jgi:4-aminobutyrate aminotransferase
MLLIADEVQSGFGRTGRWFAVEHFDLTPDIMTMAKGIASGLPLSGVAARSDLMDRWMPGSHGGTYGGNAVACAAAVATARVIKEEKLLENATRVGARLMDQLRAVQEDFLVIGDLRGLGLMIATEFTADDGSPDTKTAKAVAAGCLERGLMLLTCGPWNNTVRWIPPLIVTADQIDEGVQIFRAALADVQGEA